MDPQNPTPKQEEASASPTPSLMSLQIIWGVLLVSTVIYVIVVYSLAPGLGAADPAQTRTFELVYAVTALGCLGASSVVPRKMMTAALERESIEPGPDTPLPKLVRVALAPWIVRMALCEAVATMGLMLALISHQPVKIMPFAALALLALLAAFPSEPALRRAAER